MTNDLISRSELLAEIDQERKWHIDSGNYGAEHLMVHSLRRLVEEAPAVDAAPVVHGRWIHCVGKSNVWHCSECGGRIMYNQTRKTYNIKKLPVSEANKFCKHCGARMDKEDDNAQE